MTTVKAFLLFLAGSMAMPAAPQVPTALPKPHDYYTLRGVLDNSRLRFEREKAGRVVFLGGSITHMKGWRELIGARLQRRFPQTKFDFIDAGIPSTGSTPGAFRYGRDVLAHGPVDLLFEEAAVNDQMNGQTDIEQIRGMEGIVRQARLDNPLIDIVLLHFVDPAKMEIIRAGKTPAVILNHERVAAYYGIPSINLAQEVTERIDAGQFNWKKDFVGLHPAPFGHEIYANSIDRLFDAAWTHAPAATPQPHPMPAQPLDPKSYFRGRLVGPDVATHDKKWALVEHWRPMDQVATRAGFVNVPTLVAEIPGAILRLAFSGTAVGIFVVAGPDAGEVEYRIDDGAWATHDLYTAWSAKLHLPWAVVLAADLVDGPHELELRVADRHDKNSGGTAVRIVHFLVSGNMDATAQKSHA